MLSHALTVLQQGESGRGEYIDVAAPGPVGVEVPNQEGKAQTSKLVEELTQNSRDIAGRGESNERVHDEKLRCSRHCGGPTCFSFCDSSLPLPTSLSPTCHRCVVQST